MRKNLTPADRALWRDVLRWPESCEQGYQESYPNEERYSGLEFHRLGRGRYLVEVTCDGGGIQPGAVFMLYDGRRARSLKLRGFEGETEVRALAGFNQRRRELSLMSKADAMGTCGLFVRYSFAGGLLRVVEARRQDDCGNPDGTPDTDRWPRVRLKE
ncbi:MAG: hypothetical protein JOZ96_15100 [Acidobacteria bacterium]|nr:hypothetical protein [Acidobacteriota bacterium]